jgi:hypothetical protein
MSQYVDLALDKPRRFRLTPIDVRGICRYLNSIPGYTTGLGSPVTAHSLLALLGGRDFDAYAAVLGTGLQHEDREMSIDRAMRVLNDYLGQGGSLAPVAAAITDAGIAAGVWERAATNQANGDSPEPRAQSSTGNLHGSSPVS